MYAAHPLCLALILLVVVPSSVASLSVGPPPLSVGPELRMATTDVAELQAQLSALHVDQDAILSEHAMALQKLNASYAEADDLVKDAVLACMTKNNYQEKQRSCKRHEIFKKRVEQSMKNCAKAKRPELCASRNLPKPETMVEVTRYDCQVVMDWEQSIEDIMKVCDEKSQRRKDRFKLRTFQNGVVSEIRVIRAKLGVVTREIERVEAKLKELMPEGTPEPEMSPEAME